MSQPTNFLERAQLTANYGIPANPNLEQTATSPANIPVPDVSASAPDVSTNSPLVSQAAPQLPQPPKASFSQGFHQTLNPQYAPDGEGKLRRKSLRFCGQMRPKKLIKPL
jgi:hypothetical protein